MNICRCTKLIFTMRPHMLTCAILMPPDNCHNPPTPRRPKLQQFFLTTGPTCIPYGFVRYTLRHHVEVGAKLCVHMAVSNTRPRTFVPLQCEVSNIIWAARWPLNIVDAEYLLKTDGDGLQSVWARYDERRVLKG
jgi:hypothetical protein